MKIAGVEFGYERTVGLRTPVEQRPHLFKPLTLRGLTIRNRIMLAPMSQYLAADDGVPTDWQMVHLGQYAMGGAGIVFSEETAVEARGRRTHNCTGIYTGEQARGWRRITDFLKDLGAAPAMQLGHGGSRGSHRSPYEARRPLLEADAAIGMGPWEVVSSSSIANKAGHPAARRARPRRHSRRNRRMARRGAPCARRRLRHHRNPRRPWLSDPTISFAAHEHTHGRLWRRSARPNAFRP